MKFTVCCLLLLSASVVCAQGSRRYCATLPGANSFRTETLADASLPMVTAPSPGSSVGSLPGGPISIAQLQIPPKAIKELKAASKEYVSGNLRASVDHLEKALRIYPEFAEGHNTLGLQYIQLQQLDKALDEFRNALAKNPRFVEAVNNQTAVLFMQGRYPLAESAARHALDLDPQHKATKYLLGRILAAENQNTPETLELLRESRADYPPARLALAQLLLKRGQTDEAAKELRAYLDAPGAVQTEKIAHALAQLTANTSATSIGTAQ